jgi:ABC-2 type transport system permease protein
MRKDVRPPAAIANEASVLADLTYRNYTGPRRIHAVRWWTITSLAIRLNFKKPAFLIIAGIGLLPYLFAGLRILFEAVVGGGASELLGGGATPKYAGLLYGALVGGFLQMGQAFSLFILALIAGAGCIAADNRANALLVYLSKPVTYGDYLIGKWAGVFLSVYLVSVVPALVLYLFCLVSFLHDGFLSTEPWLIVHVLLATAVPGIIHASLLLGFSAWSKSPRVAGALYAALYVVGGLATDIISVIRHHGFRQANHIEQYFSVGGAIHGLTQDIYGVTLNLSMMHRFSGESFSITDSPPSFALMLAIGGGLVAAGLIAARLKIRAVEVVSG